ncbi:signal recognition particle-docking protein FtsY [Streptococcus anginosus]|uniref:signal recognition particle-docking protein FtsY n=1 Tax=Streptococcus anginosus TaxID=1328 RepID=UPI00124503B5|nr:signal recognition particle-docking protein FtsY [Streptococcus anginosus]MCW1038417.1 signal recognition particle-docking protein FtsY [Streptococcus anginosus]MED5841121.1 signal recognition particle-docking protein FtsY [Streptococcus anginosus]MED5927966.1 signal recognition particle-docking protein FtsY [Streptococcus anginosus]WIK86947.1 signal recognition particle-docking protein FtsY [Streptococcus anginosus]
MGLFDRLFGRPKEEKPVENIPEEAVEIVSEDDQGKNLEKVETAPVENTQSENLDEQTFQTELKERFAEDEARLETIQEKVEEMEPRLADIVADAESAENDSQAPENHTLQNEMGTPQPDETAAFSQYTTHPAATDLQSRLAEARRQQAEQENMRQLNEANAWSSSAESTTVEKTISEPIEASSFIQEETVQEKYDRSLKKTRTGFGARLNAFFANFRSVDEEFFEELEELLITSDVGVQVASNLTEALRQEVRLENAKKPDVLRRVIIEKLVDIYEKDGQFNEKINLQDGLTVMLFVGVNGVGKTTSIGKLAYKYKQAGKKVMLVAADTFRAGAVAQLVEWGRRVDVPVVTGPEKSDPASVVYDGLERAKAENVDILMVDTAGRLQNKDNLMAELEKIGRIIKRVDPAAPHETFLALDASTGQNALVQAKEFSKITPVTGIVLTKIDGTARGGVVLAIRQELDIPVKLIGFGEKIDDIGVFNSENFMKGLLEGLV